MIENLLLLLPFAILVGVPGYIFFRERMVRREVKPADHSRRRILKLTGINLGLNSLVTTYFFTIFVLLVLKLGNNTGFGELLLAIFFMLTVGITFYGNGIYITSIVLEDYTLPDLRKIPLFKTQFIATHLFHGPVSHILLYSGWLFIFLSLALLDIFGVSVSQLYFQNWLIMGGLFVGVTYAIAQIYNGTAPYQFFSGLIAFVIFFSTVFTKNLDLWFFPVALFFFALIIFFEFTLLVYVAISYLKNGSINFDRSGY